MKGAGEVKAAFQCPAGMVATPSGHYNGTPIPALCIDQSEVTNQQWDTVAMEACRKVASLWPSFGAQLLGQCPTSRGEYVAVFIERNGNRRDIPPRGEGGKRYIAPLDGVSLPPPSPSSKRSLFNFDLRDFDRPNQPHVFVRRNNALNFCAFQGKRLPTPDEWAFVASKGGWQNHSSHDGTLSRQGVVYCDSLDSLYGGRCPTKSADVGSLAGNYVEYGGQEVWDMNGNVQELTFDPTDGRFHLLGGAWNFHDELFAGSRSLNRLPKELGHTTGFRCVVPRGS